MEYAYATCILNETGEEINEHNLTAVLEAAGCRVEESRVKAIVAAMEDVELDHVTDVDVEAVASDRPGDASEGDGGDVDGGNGDMDVGGGDVSEGGDGAMDAVLPDGDGDVPEQQSGTPDQPIDADPDEV